MLIGRNHYHVILSFTSGLGAITSNIVSLITATPFQSNTFTLTGRTRGGPPTTYTWTRNGVETTRNSEVVGNGPYTISMRLISGARQADRLNPGYISTLIVTGDLPGVYEYTVSNRAMTSSVTQRFSIQGEHLIHCYSDPFPIPIFIIISPCNVIIRDVQQCTIWLSKECSCLQGVYVFNSNHLGTTYEYSKSIFLEVSAECECSIHAGVQLSYHMLALKLLCEKFVAWCQSGVVKLALHSLYNVTLLLVVIAVEGVFMC